MDQHTYSQFNKATKRMYHYTGRYQLKFHSIQVELHGDNNYYYGHDALNALYRTMKRVSHGKWKWQRTKAAIVSIKYSKYSRSKKIKTTTRRVELERGHLWDGSTKPVFTWWLVGKPELNEEAVASELHDKMTGESKGRTSRLFDDSLFLFLLNCHGRNNRLKSISMYMAVSLFSGWRMLGGR